MIVMAPLRTRSALRVARRPQEIDNWSGIPFCVAVVGIPAGDLSKSRVRRWRAVPALSRTERNAVPRTRHPLFGGGCFSVRAALRRKSLFDGRDFSKGAAQGSLLPRVEATRKTRPTPYCAVEPQTGAPCRAMLLPYEKPPEIRSYHCRV